MDMFGGRMRISIVWLSCDTQDKTVVITRVTRVARFARRVPESFLGIVELAAWLALVYEGAHRYVR